MYRDDLILGGLAAGATSTARLAEHTGMSTASVWRGLQRLMGYGHVFSPVRGVYRLTGAGAALVGLPDGELPATPEQSAAAADDRPLVGPGPAGTMDSRESGSGERLDAIDHRAADRAPASVPRVGRFDWGAFGAGVVVTLGGLAIGRLGMALLAIRRAGPPPSVPPEEPERTGALVPPWFAWR